jgi:hypothetical protein
MSTVWSLDHFCRFNCNCRLSSRSHVPPSTCRQSSLPIIQYHSLIVSIDEIISQSLNDLGGLSGLHALGVVAHNDGLAGSHGDNAGLLVLSVDGSVVGSQKEVLLASNVQTASLQRRGVVEALGQLQDLGGGHGEARGGAPDGVTGSGENGGLIDLARSNQVVNVSCVSVAVGGEANCARSACR